jgi:MAF protein
VTSTPRQTPLPLILGSSSPYRRELLQRLGLAFDCASPDIDESPLPNESPAARAERLAIQKAQALVRDFPAHLIIGSDQVAAIDNEQNIEQHLGKPGNRDNAIAQLSAASAKIMRFHTGLCLLNSQTGEYQSLVEPFTVTFRQLTNDEIERYVDAEKPFNCAGSFKSEGLGIALFESLNGRDPNTLIGLPLIGLCVMLRQIGIKIP